jgi:hypothetical protein
MQMLGFHQLIALWISISIVLIGLQHDVRYYQHGSLFICALSIQYPSGYYLDAISCILCGGIPMYL